MKTFIIDFTNDATEEQIQNFLNQHNFTIVKTFNNFEKLYLVSGEETELLKSSISSSIIQHFVNDSDHEVKMLDVYQLPEHETVPTSFSTTEEKNWWKIYSCAGIDITQETTNIKKRGKYISVYIMDSGIEETHPEFVNTEIVKLFSFYNDFTDTKGHGTAIASVIAGETCGLTISTLKIVKITDVGMPTKQSDFINALDAIASDYVPIIGTGAVVNMSWAIPKNPLIENKIQMLRDLGIIVVCAAGNSGTPIQDVTPASMDNVLTIGAYNQDFYPCDFSDYTDSAISVTQGETNHGALDGWAPGEKIYVAGLNNSYASVAGTSVAAAVVTGAMAYNLSQALSENKKLHSFVNEKVTVDIQVVSDYSLNRPLMILEGKYSDSTNKVVGYVTGSPMNLSIPYIAGAFKKGEYNSFKLFQQNVVKTVEFTELPPGLKFDKNWIVGDPLVDLGNKTHIIYNLTFELTFLDDSKDTLHMDMAILSESFDVSQIPEDDPVIDIVLLVNCAANNCGTCPGPYPCVAPSAKPPYNCFCGQPF